MIRLVETIAEFTEPVVVNVLDLPHLHVRFDSGTAAEAWLDRVDAAMPIVPEPEPAAVFGLMPKSRFTIRPVIPSDAQRTFTDPDHALAAVVADANHRALKAEVAQLHAQVAALVADRDQIVASNLRTFIHEAETPMRGHTATCCLRAALGAAPESVPAPPPIHGTVDTTEERTTP